MEFHRVGSSYVLNKSFILNVPILRNPKRKKSGGLPDSVLHIVFLKGDSSVHIHPHIHTNQPKHIHFLRKYVNDCSVHYF